MSTNFNSEHRSHLLRTSEEETVFIGAGAAPHSGVRTAGSMGTDTVLQPSSIRHYALERARPWATQSARRATRYDCNAIIQAAQSQMPDLSAFQKNTNNLPLGDRILAFLAHETINFNPKGAVRNDPTLRAKISHAVENAQPIEIAYPLMCKIPFEAKQMYNIGPTAGEEISLLFFKKINELMQTFYPPGIHIHLVSDAILYDEAFKGEAGHAAAYYNAIDKLIGRLDLHNVITLYDYKTLLNSTSYVEIVSKLMVKMAAKKESLLEHINVSTLFESVRASINTRSLKLSVGDYAEIYGPNRNADNVHWAEVEELAQTAFAILIPIRLACAEVDCCSLMWPNAIRASCHKGPKGGIWPLGLRVIPEYFKSTKLLPYHGVPLLTVKSRDAEGHARLKIEIHPEIMLAGRSDLERVTWGEQNETYFYDARNADHDLNLFA